MKQKLFSIILTLLALTSFTQMKAAFPEPEAVVTVSSEKELTEAIASVAEGDIIQLLADINLTAAVEISSDKNFKLDLNGYVLKQTGTNVRVIVNEGNLTIKDSNGAKSTNYLVKSGSDWVLQNTQPEGTEGTDYVTVYGGCITGGNLEGDGDNDDLAGGGICNYGTLNLTGGNICGNKAVYGSGIWHYGQGKTCTVSGNVKIKYNTENNLGLLVDFGAYIAIDTPESGMEIGITTYDKGPDHYEAHSGRFTVFNTSSEVKDYFFSDDSNYKVKYNEGNGSGGYLETVAKVCRNTTTNIEYETLEAAIAALTESDQTIQLLKDINLTAVVEISSETPAFTLDLNDKILKQTTEGNKAIVNNGDLTIVDNAETKTTRYLTQDSETSLWSFATDGQTDYSVSGGCIYGCHSTNAVTEGGAIANAGTLTLNSGNICGNSCIDGENGHGGGVYNEGTFKMNGGSICYNVSGESGGGISNHPGCISFTMTGGNISYNSTLAGGGIYIDSAPFTIEGGTISNNTASMGGGILVFGEPGEKGENNPIFGGTIQIKDNTGGNCVISTAEECYIKIADDVAEGMYVGVTVLDGEYSPNSGQFTTNYVTNAENYFFADDSETYSINHNTEGENNFLELVSNSPTPSENVCVNTNTGTKYTTLEEAISALTESGQTIQMLCDIDISSEIVVEPTVPAFTLDLAGYVLKQTTEGQRVMSVKKLKNEEEELAADVTIMDSKYGNESYRHYLTQDPETKLWSLTKDETEYYVDGGCITGGKLNNTNNEYAGGAIANYGTLTLNSVNICGNSCISDDAECLGGGVFNDGTFTMTDVNISYNSTSHMGGGIDNQTTLTITGGTISNNTANMGGGIIIASESEHLGQCSIKNCTITNNEAQVGGGVLNVGECTLGGTTTITGNTEGNYAFVKVEGISVSTTIADDAAEGMSVGVTILDFDDEFSKCSGQFTINYVSGAENYFFADDPETYSINHNTEGENNFLELVSNSPNVCQILHKEGDPTEYATLDEAITNVAEGETIQLLKNIDLTAAVEIASDKNFTLDLNSKTITAATNCRVFSIASGANVTIDGQGTINGSGTVDGDGGIILNYGTLTYNGGNEQIVLQNGSAINGGAIMNEEGATLNYNGGNLYENHASGNGDGIANKGTLKLTGGLIYDCYSSELGSGIGIWHEGTSLTIGGTARVEKNSLTIVDEHNLTIDNPTEGFRIEIAKVQAVYEKGEITGYTSTGGQFSTNGTADYITNGYVTTNQTGYTVSYNSDNQYLELIGGTSTNVCVNTNTSTKYTTLAKAVEEVAEGETIQMIDNTILDSQIEISDKAFFLDLNGKNITAATNCRVFLINNGAGLTITDTFEPTEEQPDNGHIYGSVVGDGENEVDGSIIFNYGTLTIAGGIFQNGGTNNNKSDGAITNGENSTFLMTGGTITGCYAAAFGGAIVCQANNTSAEISGGKICSNSALNGGAIAIENGATLTISGGEIYNNWTYGSIKDGNGLGGAVVNEGTLTITGGRIYDNHASLAGGVANRGTLALGGTAKISGNTSSDDYAVDNLCIASGFNPTITDPKEGMMVGVTLLDAQYAPTSGQFSQTIADNYSTYFFSDKDDYAVAYDSEGNYLKLVEQPDACEIVQTGTKYKSISSAIKVVEEGQTIKMLRDININSQIEVAASIPAFILDLNGYVLKQLVEDQCILWIGNDNENEQSANVTIKDSKYNDTNYPHYLVQNGNIWNLVDEQPKGSDYATVYGGCITGGNVYDGNDGGAIGNRGVLTIESGNICGNSITRVESGSNDGGAIASDGKFYMTGGEICYNYAETTGGGIIFYQDNKESIISGGKIHHNVSPKGGGISMEEGGKDHANSQLTISGGEFYNNVATYKVGDSGVGGGGAIGAQGDLTVTGGKFYKNTGLLSGGIGIAYPGSLTMTGGEVYDNTGDNVAGVGVIYMASATITGGSITGNTMGLFFNGGETITLGGDINISTNTNGNVILGNNNLITISDETPLTTTTPIGVIKTEFDMMNGKYSTTPISGQFTSNGSSTDVQYFTSDCGDFTVSYNDNGYLELISNQPEPAKTLTVSVSAVGKATVYSDQNLVVPAGVTCYGMTYDSDKGKLIYSETSFSKGDILESGKGYLIEAKEGDYVFEYTTDVPEETVASDLKGVLENKVCSKIMDDENGATIYVLNVAEVKKVMTVGFYRLIDEKTDGKDGILGANKAYYALGGGKIKLDFIGLDDETSGIENVTGLSPALSTREGAYNLSGQKVSDNFKGIVIKNGRKYLNK